MRNINKYILLTLILLVVSIGVVSASDTSNNTVSDNTNLVKSTDSTDKVVSTATDNLNKEKETINKEMTTDKIEKNVKTATKPIKITKDNYNQFFTFNTKTNLTGTTGLVQAGDILDLQGKFSNVNFTIDKANMTITSIGKTANLTNCSVTVQGLNASGSSIYNLTIRNYNPYGTCIHVNITKNLHIENNTVHTNSRFGFGIACDEMNNSVIQYNYVETSQTVGYIDIGDSNFNRTHTALVLGASYYNEIRNNTVRSDRANGIYLSLYGSGLFRGGYSDFNLITGNDVKGGNTSWSYTIQVMGKNNTITYNKVTGGYRGISTQSFTDNIIMYNKVNATAQGIYACEGAIVANNTVLVNDSTVAIEVGGPGAIIENNTIHANRGSGITIAAGNTIVRNNNITSTDSYGIYSKGKYQNINITNNTIESGKDGIMFKQQSSSKRNNFINVAYNKINAKGQYAIDFAQTGAKVAEDTHVVVSESNVLSSALGTGIEKCYNPPVNGSADTLPESNKTFVITDSNYYQYFDEGVANAKINKNDTVILSGKFTNKDFIFTLKTHVIGRNCTIYDGTITFNNDASASTMTNVTIINDERNGRLNRHGVEIVEVNNCNITNNTIINYDKVESVGVYVFAAAGNTITNNNINTSGDLVNFGVFLYSSDMNTVKNNNIFINQSGVPYEYYDEIMFNDQIGTIKEVLHNFGIVLIYSSLNTIDHNIINTKSCFTSYTFPTEECKNSIVGIDVYFDSNFNNITYNQVYMDSYGPYTYGMGVLGAPWGTSIEAMNATNNTFRKNTVKVNGGFCTTGFIAGLNSINTTVDTNSFTVTPRRSAAKYADYGYGLTLESCTNTTYSNNNLTTKGAAAYNIEFYHTNNNTVINNNFKVKGTYPYGAGGEASSDNIIQSNIFEITQKNYGNVRNATHTDSVPIGDQGIMFNLRSYRNTITQNTVKTNSNSSAVELGVNTVNNTVTNNSLQNAKTFGDKAVKSNHSSNIVKNNFLYPIKIGVMKATGKVNGTITLTATMSTRTTDTKNITATFRLGSTTIGKTNITNNKAVLTYNIPSYWRAGTYDIRVTMGGTNFQNNTGSNKAVITEDAITTVVKVNKVLGTAGSTVTINATVNDIYNNTMKGNVEFIVNGKSLGTKTLTDGKAAMQYKIPANMASNTYPVVVKYLGSSGYLASNASTILGVQTPVVCTVSRANGTIGHPTTFTAKFTANGKAVNGGKVAIKINGLTIGTATVKNGVVNYKYNLPTTLSTFKNYSVEFVYGGTDTLASTRASNRIDLYQMDTAISMNKVSVKVGQKVVLTVKVQNASKTYDATSGMVGIKINGLTMKRNNTAVIVTPVNGTVTFTFTATQTFVGQNNITITYSGNSRLKGLRQEFKNVLTITK